MIQRFRAVVAAAAGLAAAACGGDGEVLLGTLERDRVELIAEAQEPIVEVAVRDHVHRRAGGSAASRLDDRLRSEGERR